jgi:hypothetical protein
MRNKTLFSPLLFIAFILTSCEFKCSVGDTTADKEGKGKPVEKNGTLLYNGIKLEAKEVSVKKAYLVVNDDSGEMVDEGNFVDIKKGVKLILRTGDGWKVTDDRVWLGASMKVYSETGELLLNKPDMFSSIDETGITAEDSKTLALSVYFSKFEAKQPVSLDVVFTIWDKKSSALIEGSYTVHSK